MTAPGPLPGEAAIVRARCALGLTLLAGALTWAFSAPARSQSARPAVTMAPIGSMAPIASAPRSGAVTVGVDESQVLAAPGPGATVFITNPDIADAQTPDTKHVLIIGRKAGETTAYIFTAAGGVSRYAVTVTRPNAGVAEALRKQFPGATIDVFRGPAGMTVSGRVDSPVQAAALTAAAQQFLVDKEVLNFAVAVEGATQVNLQVRVASVSRTIVNNLGFDWNALFNNGSVAVGLLTGSPPNGILGQFALNSSSFGSLGAGYKNSSGSVNLAAVIDALQSNGLVTVLAEPNITTASGTTASFLVGGEFPVPIAQALDQITIEFKNYGVSMEFTPTVLDANRISIRVKPEVSELSTVGAVVINNVQIPAVAVRRADVTVELASGQSFAIAGMYQNNMSKSVSQFPGLGNLPVLGQMFRSSSFLRDQTELVILVTAYIVRPVDNPGDLGLPTEAVTYSNDLEQLLLGEAAAPDIPPPATSARPRLTGPAGFMLEDSRP